MPVGRFAPGGVHGGGALHVVQRRDVERRVRAAARLHRRPERRSAPAPRPRRDRAARRDARAGPGRPSTSTRRTASPTRVPARVRASHGRGVHRPSGCRCERCSSSSSPSARASADGDFVPAHEGPGYSDIALVRNHDFALDLLTTMEAQGLGLQQLHPEYADGQFEMSIAPRDPVGAADAAMVVRQTVRAVARRHGLVASFAPQVGTRHGQRRAPAPQSVGRRPFPDVGRRRPGGHARARRGVRRGAAGRAAGDRRGHGADLPRLPAAAAAPLVGRDAVLGHREPRGGPALHRRCVARHRGRRQHRGEAGRRHGEPLPHGRRHAGGGAARPRRRARACRPRPRRIPRDCPTR